MPNDKQISEDLWIRSTDYKDTARITVLSENSILGSVYFENIDDIERRGEIFAKIYERLYKDEREFSQKVMKSRGIYTPSIPPRIAVESNSVIVAYLYARGYSTVEISGFVQLNESTVEQYISDFLHERR